jgi:type I restriction enzyme R subunit
MFRFTESIVEQAALAWFRSAGWDVRHGAESAPGEPAAEREEYGQVVLKGRLGRTRSSIAQPAQHCTSISRSTTCPSTAT